MVSRSRYPSTIIRTSKLLPRLLARPISAMFHRLADTKGQAASGRAADGPWYYRSMDTRTQLDNEIETAVQRETFKQMLLRLLDDPQIQQKIGTFLRGSGLARSTGINVPQRWHR
jgi:hypothetical protein